MKRSEKESFVEDFRDRLEGAPVIYLTDFTGLDVKSMTALRQGLKASGAEYIVVKNRLARLALRELELPDLTEVLTGPTGFILGRDDAVEPAKVVTDFAKDHHDRPVFKLGVLDRRIVDPGQIVRLASPPFPGSASRRIGRRTGGAAGLPRDRAGGEASGDGRTAGRPWRQAGEGQLTTPPHLARRGSTRNIQPNRRRRPGK